MSAPSWLFTMSALRPDASNLVDILLPFSFPAVGRKKIPPLSTAGASAFDSGVMLLGQAERRLGVADKLAAVIADPRNPLLITHSLGSIFRARILAIACGYEDADDLDRRADVSSIETAYFTENPPCQ